MNNELQVDIFEAEETRDVVGYFTSRDGQLHDIKEADLIAEELAFPQELLSEEKKQYLEEVARLGAPWGKDIQHSTPNRTAHGKLKSKAVAKRRKQVLKKHRR